MARVVNLLCVLGLASAFDTFLSLQQTNIPRYIPPTNVDFWPSFFPAFLSTIVVEARDKTFILAALYAASRSRKAIWCAYMSVMIFITLVDYLIGYIFVPLIMKGWVNWAAVVAYIVFAYLFFRDAWYYKKEEEENPLKEPLIQGGQVSQESTQAIGNDGNTPVPWQRETLDPDRQIPADQKQVEEKPRESYLTRFKRWFNRVFKTDIYLKACVLLFLGEWSDATMISTSELAQTNQFGGVFTGCFFAYLLTCSIAVFAGRWLGGHVRKRILLILTGLIFVCFAVFTVIY